jgi:glycosyltransferase involved in cell wall biosynthesis
MTAKLNLPTFSPSNTLFLLLSFEGPDIYSQAGGLGVRMAELSRTLAEEGYETHLFFVGDPSLPGEEKKLNGRLVYHRWCQWISRYHPGGVYDGEEGKIFDYEKSLPPWILQEILKSEKNNGKYVAILSEEWHTAQTVLSLAHLAQSSPLACKPLFLWNANNTFGFHRIHWKALQEAVQITTVSKYMKHLMWNLGVNPLVIPNGIPKRWFNPIKMEEVRALRKACGAQFLLAKVGRFDPDKRWIMAIQSMAILKQAGFNTKLIMRGGIEPHGHEVKTTARSLGLKISTIKLPKNVPLKDFFQAIRRESDADVLDLQFFVPEEWLRLIYRSADAVLANSGHEPFGLVGLEVMACGGVAVTGNTGEDYALDFSNAIVVETSNPWELANSLAFLASNKALAQKLRKTGQESAKAFLWNDIVEALKRKLSFVAHSSS